MKKIQLIIPVILLITVNCFGYTAVEEPIPAYTSTGASFSQENYPVEDTSYVYNFLAPYGDWVEMSSYGYVWVPRHMGYRWRPYTEGRWVWSDYGWTWISDLPWGDIPFHYGRWGWDDGFGWFWVPGDVWGPAWVSWRSSDFYFGWAPLPPGIDLAFGIDFDSIFLNVPNFYWVFCDADHFMDRDVRRYVVPFERNRSLITTTTFHNNIRLRNNRAINEGIDVNDVRRITRRQIRTYQVAESGRPGREMIKGNTVHVFRAEIRPNSKAKPQQPLNAEEARQKLNTAKIFEPHTERPLSSEEAAARQRQKVERKLMQQSHQKELNQINKMRSQEERNARNNPAQRENIRRNYENQRAQIQARHEGEMREMQTRHSNDQTHMQNVRRGQGQPPRTGGGAGTEKRK